MLACFKFPKYTAQMRAKQRSAATGGSWGKGSPQERTHQLIVQYQTVRP